MEQNIASQGVKIKKINSFLTNFLNLLVLVIASFFPFRFYFGESVIGESFDTKAQLAFHEHWFDFLNGSREFLDAGFFYPYKYSFALSDLFIVSGPIHAILRFCGFDLLDSLKLSTLIIIVFSNLGWLLLANKIIKNLLLRFLFVLTIGTSYTYIGHIYEKPNMAAYGLISWFILNIVSISRFKDQSSIKTTNALGLLLTIPLILSLNVWYSAYFIFLFSAATFIVFLFTTIMTRNLDNLYRTAIEFLTILNKKILSCWIFLFIFLSFCLLLVYLPQTKSDYSAVNTNYFLSYSPTITSFFDTTGSGGGFTTDFFHFLFTKNEFSPEMNLGIHPIIFILFFLSIFALYSNIRTSTDLSSIFLLSGIIANILLVFSLIKLQNSISIFSFFWDNFSLLRTMRIPIRFNVIFNFIALIFIFYILDKLFIRYKILGKSITLLITILLLADMQRIPYVYWYKEDLIDKNLISYTEQLTNCDSFVIDREEVAWWKDSIDGLILSTIIKIPTVNGFSSIYPKDYPNINWTESSNLAGIINWLKTKNAISDSCLITHGEEVIRLDQNPVLWSAQQGFTRREVENKNSWNWMVHPKGDFLVYNLTSSSKELKFNFKIKSPPCNYGQNVLISSNNDSFVSKLVLENKPIQISFDSNLGAFESMIINFQTDANSCKIGSDPRKLYLSINDFKIIEKQK